MNFSAKLRLYFHICKSFLEKLLKKLWTPYISFSLHVSSSCSSMPSSWHSLLCQLPSFLPPIVGPAVLLALLFFNLTFIALGNSYIPTEELLDKEEENQRSGEENQRNEEEKTFTAIA